MKRERGKGISVQKMTMTAMMAALIAVFSWISIPLPSGVPMTVQTLGIAFAGYVLGPVCGVAAVMIWMLLGIIGIPVFAGFGSGIGTILGLTGGFIIGFPFMAALCGIGKGKPMAFRSALGLAGLAIVECFGAWRFGRLSGNAFGAAFLLVVMPYLIKDILCVIFASGVSRQVIRAVKAAGY